MKGLLTDGMTASLDVHDFASLILAADVSDMVTERAKETEAERDALKIDNEAKERQLASAEKALADKSDEAAGLRAALADARRPSAKLALAFEDAAKLKARLESLHYDGRRGVFNDATIEDEARLVRVFFDLFAALEPAFAKGGDGK